MLAIGGSAVEMGQPGATSNDLCPLVLYYATIEQIGGQCSISSLAGSGVEDRKQLHGAHCGTNMVFATQ